MCCGCEVVGCRMLGDGMVLEAGGGVEEKVQATSRSARAQCSLLVTALYRSPPLSTSTLPNITADKIRYCQCSYSYFPILGAKSEVHY